MVPTTSIYATHLHRKDRRDEKTERVPQVALRAYFLLFWARNKFAVLGCVLQNVLQNSNYAACFAECNGKLQIYSRKIFTGGDEKYCMLQNFASQLELAARFSYWWRCPKYSPPGRIDRHSRPEGNRSTFRSVPHLLLKRLSPRLHPLPHRRYHTRNWDFSHFHGRRLCKHPVYNPVQP